MGPAENAKNCFYHEPNPDSERSKNVVIFDITSSSDLRQCVVIDSRATCIKFRSYGDFPVFRGTIEVEFLPLSVFGKEKVFFEIVPDTIIMTYNHELAEKAQYGNINDGITIKDTFAAGEKLEGIRNAKGMGVDARKTNGRIVTPILHIDRQNGSPFLRQVKVTLPLMNDETLQTDIEQSKLKMGDRVTMGDVNNIQFQQTKFSPVAGVYNPVRKLLNAFCFTGDKSLDFETEGVYFIAKQDTAEEVNIDLRLFRTWQEHRRYRMDERATYFLVINPQKVESRDHYSEVQIRLKQLNTSKNFI